MPSSLAADDARPRARPPRGPPGAERARRARRSAACEARHPSALDLEARSRAVPSEAKTTHRTHRRCARDASAGVSIQARPGRLVPPAALDQARGDDPDHPGVPPRLPACTHAPRPPQLSHPRLGLEADAHLRLPCARDWLAIAPAAICSKRRASPPRLPARGLRRPGAAARLCSGAAPWGTRTDRLSTFAESMPAYRHQRGRTRAPLCAGQRVQPAAHERAASRPRSATTSAIVASLLTRSRSLSRGRRVKMPAGSVLGDGLPASPRALASSSACASPHATAVAHSSAHR